MKVLQSISLAMSASEKLDGGTEETESLLKHFTSFLYFDALNLGGQ
jgi:hypothetical protein